ncbi:hypothetical protein HS125_01320 [bacterium]|nr:hypothetical protein [bacterium]
MPVRPVAVTATELRRRLAHDLAVEEWVPAAVLAIIRREGLYRQTGSR